MVMWGFASGACTPYAVAEPTRRAMYVQNPTALTSDRAARKRLYAQLESRAVCDIVPYGLGPLLETAAGRTILAALLDDLHAHGARVIAPIASIRRLASFDDLFREHPAVFVDGVITESEYWNASDRTAAFDTFTALLAEMRGRTSTWNNRALQVGAYLGYPTATEAAAIATQVDFVYLNYAVSSPDHAWTKTFATRGSLRARYAAFTQVERWPIFYATGEVDMRASLKTRGLAAAERTFTSAVAADPELSRYAPTGFAYFTFETMP
jgi:hypothetical protein